MDRSVANLTTEQLYRKRAFDRANQRASRARKKSRITELEEEVKELKRQLARSEDQVKRLQSSEAELRNVINTARSSLQMIDAATSSTQAAIPSPPASTPTSSSGNEDISSIAQTTASPSIRFPSDHDQISNLTTAVTFDESHASSEQSTSENVKSLALRDQNTGLTLGLPLTPNDTMFHFWDDGFPADLTSSNYSLAFLDPFPSESMGTPWSSSSANLQIPSLEEPHSVPQWERLPLHIGANCRLDTVLLGLLQSSRRHEPNSGTIAEFSGSAFPSIGSLLNPETESSQNPISNTIGMHGIVTMNVSHLPTKIGMMYNMCVLMRWLISPTKRNYDAMPEYLKPLESQLTTPHPIWVDCVVWPEARERIIKSMDWSEFPDFRAIGNKTISINWPYDQSKVFTMVSPKELRLNPLFENHIRQVRHWTFGYEVSERFPFLKCVPTSVHESQDTRRTS